MKYGVVRKLCPYPFHPISPCWSSPYFLPCNSWNVRSENLVLDQFFSLVDIFLFFFSFPCLVDCKEKFCLGHSWELSNYWFFFRFLVALFPVSRLIKVWYEEPFLFIITSMNVRVPILLLSQLIEYIVTKLFLSQDDYILFPYEPLVYWVRTDQMEWLCATLS